MADQDYIIPPGTRIGHVHLKVADLKRSLEFYCDVLGFSLMQTYGSEAAFVSAGRYHHHIGLNTWHSKGRPPAARSHPGLYHVAILFEGRKELARAVQRIIAAGYPISGASDHGVSVAVYLSDPDENGIELYYDRPEKEWPRNAAGGIDMFTRPIDMQELLRVSE